MQDHYAEAEQLLEQAAAHRVDDPNLAEQLTAEAAVNVQLAGGVTTADAGCGDEPVVSWDELLKIASKVWADGGAPPLPKLEAIATELGLVVVESKPRDAHTRTA